jgi:hypothetical protein
MSAYLFIAANMPLDDVVNTKIKHYSIEKTDRLSLLQKTDTPLPSWWEITSEAGRRKENQVIYVESEDSFGKLEVLSPKQNGIANVARSLYNIRGCTEKPYLADMQFRFTTWILGLFIV